MATFRVLGCAGQYFMNGTADIDTAVLKCALLASSASAVIATATTWADVSAHEISTAGGYTTGGNTVTVSSVSRSSNVTTVTLANVEFNASGGDIDAHRYQFFYFAGTKNSVTNPAFAFGFESESVDVAAIPDGLRLLVRPNGGGQFTVTVNNG